MKTFFIDALILITATIASAQADTYPSHPITLVAPTTAGGPPDT